MCGTERGDDMGRLLTMGRTLKWVAKCIVLRAAALSCFCLMIAGLYRILAYVGSTPGLRDMPDSLVAGAIYVLCFMVAILLLFAYVAIVGLMIVLVIWGWVWGKKT